MTDIRPFIVDNLLEPLKHYPTIIQDTMVEIIIQRLQEVYDYTVKFPEIVSPDKSRLDILKAIADQFLFTIRDEADIQEQIDILENILHVYNRRGSIDTIENMWEYYGGDLPKDVKVIIPSYNLFRYSVSELSGTHTFIKQKGEPDEFGRVDMEGVNSPGIYEIKLVNNTYPIPDLKEFLLKELVTAGTEFYFTNDVHLDITEGNIGSNPYYYEVYEDTFIDLQIVVNKIVKGLTLSGQSHQVLSYGDEDAYWSGAGSILLELLLIKDLGLVDLTKDIFFRPLDILTTLYIYDDTDARYWISVLYADRPEDHLVTTVSEEHELYCTPNDYQPLISSDLDEEDNYIGYFILGSSLLDREIGTFYKK